MIWVAVAVALALLAAAAAVVVEVQLRAANELIEHILADEAPRPTDDEPVVRALAAWRDHTNEGLR